MRSLLLMSLALLLGCGGATPPSPRMDAGADAGLDAGTNVVSGDGGFTVASTDSSFGPLPDGGTDYASWAGVLLDTAGMCADGPAPSAPGSYRNLEVVLQTPDLARIPPGTYGCGKNVPLGGGHVLLRMQYDLTVVDDAGVPLGQADDFSSCTLELDALADDASGRGRFQGVVPWLDGGSALLEGTFSVAPCRPPSG